MTKLEKATNTDLKKLSEMIKRGELLLPDFQRGFVWKEEMQTALIASVLAKMPIGSILLLEAKVSDYGCRILGRKDEPDTADRNPEEDIYVLLDGQQRLTVLMNVFSDLLYYDYSGSKALDCDYKKLISTELKNRFFLEIPSVDRLTEENDLFCLKSLDFSLKNPESDVPDFLTGDIAKYIKRERFDKETGEPFAPHTNEPVIKLKNYCIQEERYLIPLYLLIEDGGSAIRLKTILESIVQEIVQYRLEREYDLLQSEREKECFIREYIADDYIEEILTAAENGKNKRDVLEEKWKKMGETYWADRMKRYLMSCVNRLDLHQIIVDASNRNRAIDIYENLNLGGVALSTFELVLAKAAKKKHAENKNLYDAIVEFIQTPGQYDEAVLPDCIQKSFSDYIERNRAYSASEHIGCLDEKKNQLNKKYTAVFLNVLSLVSNFPDYRPGEGAVGCIKRQKILELTEEDIWKNYQTVCEGIDRAYYFLQARCGIRRIEEVNYDLMVVLLGYILSNDNFYHEKNVIQLLDSWYWSAVFSGRYDKDQNEHAIEDIRNVLAAIRDKEEMQWLDEMRDKVFNMPGFSDEDTLLLRTTVVPKGVIQKKICQFYLAKTYPDLRTDEKLSVFCDSADRLEEHHIVPIGSMTLPIRDMEKEEKKNMRSNRRNIFNSPLNFAYITKKSNQEISNHSIDFYVNVCNPGGVYGLHIDTSGDGYNAERIMEILKERFDKTKEEVKKQINTFV